MELKIVDRLMNELKPGATYHFRPLDAPITLKEVQQPGVIDKTVPGRIVLEVTIPFMPDKPNQTHIVFQDLMQVVHPAETNKVSQQIDDIMSGKTPPAHSLKLEPPAVIRKSKRQGG